MAPAAISARPAVTTMAVESMTPETPAASANGTVSPSDIPITMSRTIALAVKCCSTCGVSGMAPHILTISRATSRYPLAMPPEATILLGAALVFLGFLVGSFGTLIGAGGGFLLVPLLLIGYHFQPPDAVGTSLALVFLNAASGSFAYLRQRRVDLSSAFGIGGGIIHVPFLIVMLGLPVHIATATSHFVLSISTLVGAGTFFALGHVDLTTTVLMGAGILAGAQVGARLSIRTRPVTIRRFLALTLVLVGIRMVLHALTIGPW